MLQKPRVALSYREESRQLSDSVPAFPWHLLAAVSFWPLDKKDLQQMTSQSGQRQCDPATGHQDADAEQEGDGGCAGGNQLQSRGLAEEEA